MGLVVVGFGLLDICLWYLILDKVVYTAEHMQSGFQFLIEDRIILLKQTSPLGMPYKHVPASHGYQHGAGYFPGYRSFRQMRQVLSPQLNVTAA